MYVTCRHKTLSYLPRRCFLVTRFHYSFQIICDVDITTATYMTCLYQLSMDLCPSWRATLKMAGM